MWGCLPPTPQSETRRRLIPSCDLQLQFVEHALLKQSEGGWTLDRNLMCGCADLHRRELVNAFAIGSCIANTAPALSSLWPLAMIQSAIEACEAEMRLEP